MEMHDLRVSVLRTCTFQMCVSHVVFVSSEYTHYNVLYYGRYHLLAYELKTSRKLMLETAEIRYSVLANRNVWFYRDRQ
jgi:hypothetical protein